MRLCVNPRTYPDGVPKKGVGGAAASAACLHFQMSSRRLPAAATDAIILSSTTRPPLTDARPPEASFTAPPTEQTCVSGNNSAKNTGSRTRPPCASSQYAVMTHASCGPANTRARTDGAGEVDGGVDGALGRGAVGQHAAQVHDVAVLAGQRRSPVRRVVVPRERAVRLGCIEELSHCGALLCLRTKHGCMQGRARN